jgi:hypothetical protein
MSSRPDYQSYLLRLWRDSANQPWRASLQCTATGEKLAFADLPTLFTFLSEQLTDDEKTDELARLAAWLQAQRADQ